MMPSPHARIYAPLFVYCGLAVAISWSLWLPLVLAGGSASGPLRYLHLLGGLGPAVAGIACAGWFGGKPALALMLQRIGSWPVPLRWHLVAWLSPFALLALALLLASLATGGAGWTVFAANPEFPELSTPVYWIAVLIFSGFGEEIGWRGFALPVLQSRLSPVPATLILSVIWAAWHLPLFWFPGLGDLGLGGLVGWYLSLLTGAAILTWLTNSTRGSILIAAAFHTTMDLAFSPSISSLATTLMGAAITFWGLAVLVRLRLPSRAPSVTLPL